MITKSGLDLEDYCAPRLCGNIVGRTDDDGVALCKTMDTWMQGGFGRTFSSMKEPQVTFQFPFIKASKYLNISQIFVSL